MHKVQSLTKKNHFCFNLQIFYFLYKLIFFWVGAFAYISSQRHFLQKYYWSKKIKKIQKNIKKYIFKTSSKSSEQEKRMYK